MINPILRNEMKTDSRQFRFYVLLMLYVALLGTPILLLYNAFCKTKRINAEDFIIIYMFLACMQAIILMFIVPALTANSITGEREKQTLDILLTTQMTPRSIIWGKLLGAVSRVILLIICTMPIYAIVLFLGGIRMTHIIACNLYLIMTTIFVASMCIWISTMVKTSKFANVTAYFAELGIIIGYPIAVWIWMIINTDFIDKNQSVIDIIMNILCVSPAVGYGHLLLEQLGTEMDLFGSVGNVGMIAPGWLISVGVQIVLTIIFLEAAIKKLNPIKKKHKVKKVKQKKVLEQAS